MRSSWSPSRRDPNFLYSGERHPYLGTNSKGRTLAVDTIVRVLFIGDVIGRPGRKLVADFLPEFRRARSVHFVVANAENAAGGKGLTADVATDLFDVGVDVLTGGNHTWHNRDILQVIDSEPRILRPANYAPVPEVPGRGFGVYAIPSTPHKIGILNLLGRAFMAPIDCPFQTGRALVERLRQETPLVVVDIHAEATSEKIALAWYLDGLVTAVIGTHTHVPTADETITALGTAMQTDVGMTGPYDGVLGVRKDIIIHNMITQLPVRHELAKGDLRLCATLIEADPQTGHALAIERICHKP